MKGFYIEITNNLLESKHRKRMKEAVWLFMWLIDKMTSVSEEGVGKVLGGKPIKYEEVSKDLGISRRTYVNWIDILKKGKYINTLRTPVGLVITINKAKKRFKRDVQKSAYQGSDVQNLDSDVQKNVSDVQKRDIQYKTINKDNNKDNTKISKAKALQPFNGKDINDLIDKFKKVNPSYERLFGNTTQRKAMERLLKKYGKEKLERIIDWLPKIFGKPYAPTITTPYMLEQKLAELIAFIKKKSEEKISFVDLSKL